MIREIKKTADDPTATTSSGMVNDENKFLNCEKNLFIFLLRFNVGDVS